MWQQHNEQQVKELAREIGALVRAASVWGNEKATGEPSQFTLDCVLGQVEAVLKSALRRDPNGGEIEWVWEQPS